MLDHSYPYHSSSLLFFPEDFLVKTWADLAKQRDELPVIGQPGSFGLLQGGFNLTWGLNWSNIVLRLGEAPHTGGTFIFLAYGFAKTFLFPVFLQGLPFSFLLLTTITLVVLNYLIVRQKFNPLMDRIKYRDTLRQCCSPRQPGPPWQRVTPQWGECTSASATASTTAESTRITAGAGTGLATAAAKDHGTALAATATASWGRLNPTFLRAGADLMSLCSTAKIPHVLQGCKHHVVKAINI